MRIDALIGTIDPLVDKMKPRPNGLPIVMRCCAECGERKVRKSHFTYYARKKEYSKVCRECRGLYPPR